MERVTSFAQALKQRRRERDLTQQELAQQVGCAVVTIQRIEQGTLRPSRQIVQRLTAILHIPADERERFVYLARGVPLPDASKAQPDVPAGARSSRPLLPIPLTPLMPDASKAQPDVPAGARSSRPLLPIPLTPLIGRVQEVAAVRATLTTTAVRLLTLIGPGGVGKTRLALQVAADLGASFADGAAFVDLAPIGDPDLVASNIAQVLGLHDLGSQPLIVTLQRSLRDKQLLLILDNFEQVVRAAPLVATLLEAAPQLKMLLTSRVVVGVYGEYTFLVPPLTLPNLNALPPHDQLLEVEAVRLFVTRALATRPDFRLTEVNIRTVSEICHRLDGLPLALELAAARVRLLPPQALLERLSSRLELLRGGPRTLPARQQTLRDTIDWSHGLLDPEEQRLFRRLAVFVGGCTLEAIEAVCKANRDPVPNVVDGVAALLDKSLLRLQTGAEGQPRFVMLETIREYALERLAAREEVDPLRDRHLDYYLTLAEAAAPHIRQPGQMGRLRDDHDNLRTAFGWAIESGAIERAARISAALQSYMESRGLLSEARAWFATVLARRAELSDPTRAKVLWAAAEIADSVADQSTLFEESLSIFRALGDKSGMAAVLPDLGGLAQWHADYTQARTYYEENLALCRELGDRNGEIGGLIRLGRLALGEGDHPRAVGLHEEALALAQANGYVYGVARALFGLGEIAHSRGERDQAAAHYAEALALMRELEQSGHTAHVLIHLGELALQQGDLAGATAHYTECLELVIGRSDSWGRAHCLGGFAQLAAARGQLELATRLAGAAIALFDAIAVPLTYTERANFDRVVTGWRAQLDEATFAAAWAKGRTMTLEQTINDALNATSSAATHCQPSTTIS